MSKLAAALLIVIGLLLWCAIGYNAWLHMKHSGPSDWLFDTRYESP